MCILGVFLSRMGMHMQSNWEIMLFLFLAISRTLPCIERKLAKMIQLLFDPRNSLLNQ